MSITTHDTGRRATADIAATVLRAIANAGRAVGRAYMENRRHSAERLLIASLTDRQLRDLGISRDRVPTRRFLDPYAV
jgi:uncharacterized protein YjiS (DUF1127 family)